jgi:ABC-2 type transport system permease protein
VLSRRWTAAAPRRRPLPAERRAGGGRVIRLADIRYRVVIRLADDLRGAGAVIRRDWRIALSHRTRFVTHLLSAFFMLTAFHFIARLVRASAFSTPGAYFAFALIGLITLQVLNAALHRLPRVLGSELVAGTFERLVISPFGGVRALVAMLVFPFAYALCTAVAMLVLAGLLFGVHLHWTTMPLAAPIAVLGALSFAPFGLLLLAIVLLSRQAIAGATFVVAGISLISGLYFPISILPAWMRALSNVQPFTPAADLMRHVIVGTSLHQPLAAELSELVGYAAVGLPVSALLLSLALRLSRRRGAIVEYR